MQKVSIIVGNKTSAGEAPGIFRWRDRPFRRGGLKYGFQGTINAKNLRKKSFFSFERSASMLRREAIAP